MILLTGGAGFIGSHLADRLVQENEEIVILDDFNDYYPVRFKEENLSHLTSNKQIQIERGDISDRDFVRAVFKRYQFDKVIHLAARAGVRPSIADPFLYQRVNIGGIVNILEAMKEAKCPALYFASSSSVYGNQGKVPFSESDNVDTPISPYAASKKACELFAYTYHHLYGIKTVGFRFFTVYGERGRPDMAPYLFTEKILKGEPISKFGDGTTERDYTYIDDIIEGIMSALKKDFSYEIFNLGNHQTVSLNKLIATVEDLTGEKAVIAEKPRQPGDVPRTYADIDKAKNMLGYDPKTSIEEGLAHFVKWYKAKRL